MKSIVVFVYGDANNPSTWSNVPYLFTTALEKKGYKVIRQDISTKQNIFTLFYSLVCKIIRPSTTFYFYRSKINRKIVEKKIKRTVEKYDNCVELYISMSFDFSPSEYTKKDVVLLSDWPIEYALERRYGRLPDFLEKRDIQRHKKVIENATYVISLFQDAAEYINQNFNNKAVYLGGLINGLCDVKGFEQTENRNYITFIGKKAYYQSAKQVVEAFEKLSPELVSDKGLELHIIGMNKGDFKNGNNPNVFFHGYLSKGKKDEYEEYYDIMRRSMVLINTNKKWAGMSSILEAMYYYRPIITSKYEEFVKTFGENINFGFYCENDSDEIKKCIEKISASGEDEYKALSVNAHTAVKDFTYASFVEKIEKLTGRFN